jgi:hypothetical protein
MNKCAGFEKSIHRKLFIILVSFALVSLAGAGHSGDKKKFIKKEMQEKSCDLVNGKMECTIRKVKTTKR